MCIRDRTDLSHLSQSQKRKVLEVLEKHRAVFARSDMDVGCTNLVDHVIDTGDSPPAVQPYRAVPKKYQAAVKAKLEELEEHGIIEKSDSCWASNLVIVPRGKGIRICTDLTSVNAP